MAQRQHVHGEAADGLDPAGRAAARGRRRHVLREHARRVRWPVAAAARARRRSARRPRHHEADAQGDRAPGTRTSISPRCSERWPPVEHPVVVTHPETGRKALFVNRNSTTHLVGLTDRENDVLLPFLLDHVRSPDFQCRFHWEAGSIAFWDNRSVQHYARRRLHRATRDAPRHHRRDARVSVRGAGEPPATRRTLSEPGPSGCSRG